MQQVGVRELRQQASQLLRRVEAGETIEITDRGRPVALLAPLAATRGPLDRLRLAGQVIPAMADIDTLPEPLPLAPGREAPSAVLARLRRDER
jgi:prevent-host-death family protein